MGQAIDDRTWKISPSPTVALADIASGLRRQGIDVVDFSAGRAAEATPTVVRQAAIRALEAGDTHQTEARGRPSYLQACAEKLKREQQLSIDPEKNVVATLGCKQGLLLSLLAILEPGDEIILEDPGFVSYQPEVRIAGGIPVPVPLRRENGFRWDPVELQAAIGPRTRAMLICSPHNPTGIVHTRKDLQAIAHLATKNDLTIISDEIYEAVVWGGKRHLPIASLPDMQDRTIGLMGLTKTYSMGGWRIGYAYSSEQIVNRMVILQQHLITCASSFAQQGASTALSEHVTKEMKALWQDWEERCRFVTSRLDKLPGLRATMPEGGFYAWVDISGTGLTSAEFAHRLLDERHVATVPGSGFGQTCDDYVRVTCVRGWEELRLGLERIEAFVRSLTTV